MVKIKSDLSDTLMERTGPPKEDSTILQTLMESVAFCIYDRAKVEEIFRLARDRLYNEHRLIFDYEVKWNPPTIVCDPHYEL